MSTDASNNNDDYRDLGLAGSHQTAFDGSPSPSCGSYLPEKHKTTAVVETTVAVNTHQSLDTSLFLY
jgi:hypothetical protein